MAQKQIWRPKALPKPLEDMNLSELQAWYAYLMDQVDNREREQVEAPGPVTTDPFIAARQHVFRRLEQVRAGK